jgi:hypothetical protein
MNMAVSNRWCAGLLLVSAALASMLAQPVQAQSMLLGYWEPIYDEDVDERIPGPAADDYAGLPISEASRLRGHAWDPEILTVPEHECIPHPSTYGFRGIGTLRIWEDLNPYTQAQTEIETWIAWESQHRHIYMDGRAHPPAFAPHTWEGFSLGHWEADVLVVHTDMLKAGWIRRNGLPLTDRATLDEHFFRHGDILTDVMVVSDPIYLTEPMVKTNEFQFSVNTLMIAYPCRPATEIPRPKGQIPSHLPGQDPYLHEYADKHNMPFVASEGGAETALPEFQDVLIKFHANASPKAKASQKASQ